MSDADVILDDLEEEGRLVSLAEVREMLDEAAQTREEMTYEQKIALEHARRFARIDADTAAALVKDIMAAMPDVDEKYAMRVADLLPQHPDDVLAIFQKSRHELTDDDLEKVLEIVDKHYVA